MKEKEYLGDAVYAQNDGFGLLLTTEDGGARVTNEIYLEPSTYNKLIQYMDKCVKNTMGDVPNKE